MEIMYPDYSFHKGKNRKLNRIRPICLTQVGIKGNTMIISSEETNHNSETNLNKKEIFMEQGIFLFHSALKVQI